MAFKCYLQLPKEMRSTLIFKIHLKKWLNLRNILIYKRIPCNMQYWYLTTNPEFPISLRRQLTIHIIPDKTRPDDIQVWFFFLKG